MKLHDKITFQPNIDGVQCEPTEGVICYIHPNRRYYTVAYPGKSGATLRESFSCPHRRGESH